MKTKMIVFAGKPGVGKTTIINQTFPQHPKIDILDILIKYGEEGNIPEEKTATGYQEMYENLTINLQNNDFILEIGTNHPELNISELAKLNEIYDIDIFLCNASKDVCRERVFKRGMRHSPLGLETRLNRDFPNSYASLLKNTKIKHQVLNTEQPLVEIIKNLKDKFSN